MLNNPRCNLILPKINLGLDSKEPLDISFISHAHTDHLSNHKRIIVSKPTYSFYKIRMRDSEAEPIVLDYYQPLNLNNHRLNIFPAGHILGSAQIIIEGETTIVYTGDIKLRRGKTCEPIEIVQCDILIMEATFGHPRYVFPPQDELYALLKKEIEQALNQSAVPVVFAYSLGKAQETIAILQSFGFSVTTEAKIKEYLNIYQEYGITFGPVTTLDQEWGEVLILPLSPRWRNFVAPLLKKRTIFLSGWGIDPKAKYQFQVDVVLPISDHCDYNELLQYVKIAQPKKVYLFCGFDEFCNELKRKGIPAQML
ncbi:MAG: MBL fold metallo-hydrolase [candidate division WOR-3 bacterium]